MDPKVQDILNEINARKSGNYSGGLQSGGYQTGNVEYTTTIHHSDNPGVYRTTERVIESSPREYHHYSENVKRSGAPSHHTESHVVSGPEVITHHQQGPMLSMSYEEWQARQNSRPQQIESITEEEWLRRKSNYNAPVQTITHEEWIARQNANNNVYVSSSPEFREEGVKRSGNVGHVSYVTSNNVTPYDYRDFRPRDFTYEYREQRPVQYETIYEKAGPPVNRIVYEEPRVVKEEVRVHEEKTKQKKPPVVLESHEKKHSGWCC